MPILRDGLANVTFDKIKETQKKLFKIYKILVWQGAQDFLHHGQVLPVVVGLEERESEIQLEHDAADAPDVTGLRPS